TADKDFGELVFRQRQASTGVLLVRLWGLTPATKASVVSDAIQEHGRELPGRLCCAEPWEHPHPSHAPSVGTEKRIHPAKRRSHPRAAPHEEREGRLPCSLLLSELKAILYALYGNP